MVQHLNIEFSCSESLKELQQRNSRGGEGSGGKTVPQKASPFSSEEGEAALLSHPACGAPGDGRSKRDDLFSGDLLHSLLMVARQLDAGDEINLCAFCCSALTDQARWTCKLGRQELLTTADVTSEAPSPQCVKEFGAAASEGKTRLDLLFFGPLYCLYQPLQPVLLFLQ